MELIMGFLYLFFKKSKSEADINLLKGLISKLIIKNLIKESMRAVLTNTEWSILYNRFMLFNHSCNFLGKIIFSFSRPSPFSNLTKAEILISVPNFWQYLLCTVQHLTYRLLRRLVQKADFFIILTNSSFNNLFGYIFGLTVVNNLFF